MDTHYSLNDDSHYPLIVKRWILRAHLNDGDKVQMRTYPLSDKEPFIKACETQQLPLVIDQGENKTFASLDTYVEITPSYALLYSREVEVFQELERVFTLHQTKSVEIPAKNPVYLLIEGMRSYSLRSMGQPGKPLIESNYNPHVIQQFRRLQQGLEAEVPKGRVGLILGQPGTGKSFLIRALLDRYSPGVAYVLLNSKQLLDLSNNLDKYLNLLDNMDSDLKTIFILEDADDLLVERQAENMKAIQALLNMGDGLIGEALNIRLILTTNAKAIEIDQAITRFGRLIEKIEVGQLSKEQAEIAHINLAGTGKPRQYHTPTTLAEVYHNVGLEEELQAAE